MSELSLMIEPVALGFVFGGSAVVALLQNGVRDWAQGLLYPFKLAHRRSEQRSTKLASLVVEDLIQTRGIGAADRGPSNGGIVTRLATVLADSPNYHHFSDKVRECLSAERHREQRSAEVWSDIADAAPAFGMLGTVIGLVNLFSSMENMQNVGSGLAVCLLTTLYGLMVAHIVAGPISRRMVVESRRRAEWQECLTDSLLASAEREFRLHPVTRDAPDADPKIVRLHMEERA